MAASIESEGAHPIHMATTTIKVDGMTCGACTSSVESGFKNVDGAGAVSVSLVMGRAVIQHNPEKLTPEQIAEIIEDRGFDAEVISTNMPTEGQGILAAAATADGSKTEPMSTTVSISGMTCGACTSAVEGAFKNVDGVLGFNISLLAERAVIVHDPTLLPVSQIVESIEDAGFDAKVVSTEPQNTQSVSKSSSVQLKIYGLTDGSAATALETSLRGRGGVDSAVINLSSSRATIVYNSSLIGLRALVEFIETFGYNALVADQDDNNAQLESLAKTKEIQEWRRSFFFSVSFAVPVFCISMLIPMFIPALDFGSATLIPGLYLGDLLCLLLTIPVQFGIGKRFYISAYKSLQHGSPTMDVLVVLGTSAAFFYSVFAVIMAILVHPHDRPNVVFDTSTMLITFITLGRWLENRAKGKTSAALSQLMSLAPSMTTIYDDPIAADKAAEGWDEPFSPMVEKKTFVVDEETAARRQAAGQKIIPTELLQVGDVVILRPGDKVPADGTVTRGESYVDESMVTGEAMQILKKKGSSLIAGTVNQEGRVDFKVTRAGKDTQLSQIINLVQEAQTSRAPIQRLADKIAGMFVPAIIILALITFVGWMILSHVLSDPPAIFLDNHSGGKFMVCLKLCISVVVFACPCALGLATPTAVMVGTGTGATHGILVKGGAALETATKITHVVFDKTGTLTMGKMTVSEANIEAMWSSNDWRKRLWWSLVGLAESSSEHPIGKAILKAAKQELGIDVDESIDGSIGGFENTVGKGISVIIEPASSNERSRYQVFIGNAQFLESKGVKVPAAMDPSSSESSPERGGSSRSRSPSGSGVTCIHIAIDSGYAGTLALTDELKPTAPAAVAALHKMGITTSIVTGDTYNTAVSVAKLVGIPADSIRASALPHQKQEIIAELKAQGEIVAMVGDGVNDSPALACANTGIALSSGTDVAMEAADVVIMRAEDLLNIPAALHLSKTIFRRIQTNLFLSCIYNVIGLPFAMGIFLPFGLHLHPMAAGAAMAASSVTVVTNSLLLKLWKRPSWMSVESLDREIKQNGGWIQPLRRRHRGVLFTDIFHGLVDGFESIIGLIRWRSGDRKDIAYVPLTTVEA